MLEPNRHTVLRIRIDRAVDAPDEIEFGGPCGDRTHDLRIQSLMLNEYRVLQQLIRSKLTQKYRLSQMQLLKVRPADSHYADNECDCVRTKSYRRA